jgi:hypothetical protein
MKIILKFFVFSFVSCENGYHLDLHKEYNSYKKRTILEWNLECVNGLLRVTYGYNSLFLFIIWRLRHAFAVWRSNDKEIQGYFSLSYIQVVDTILPSIVNLPEMFLITFAVIASFYIISLSLTKLCLLRWFTSVVEIGWAASKCLHFFIIKMLLCFATTVHNRKDNWYIN